jgi:hypothetical protein
MQTYTQSSTPGVLPSLSLQTWSCWDLGVLGAPAGSTMNPQFSVLTTRSRQIGGLYNANNSVEEPSFVASYGNGARNQTIVVGENIATATILVPAAFDEGGNWIRPLFGPLTLNQPDGTFYGNHHVTAGVNGQNLTTFYGSVGAIPPALGTDFDGEVRPLGGAGTGGPADRGADEKLAAPAPTTPVPTRR